MSFELYNKSNQVKTIPKYRYNGKYTLAPKQAVDIEEYMIDFFRPFARVDIIVRNKAIKENENKTVGTPTNEIEPKLEEVKEVMPETVETEQVKETMAEETMADAVDTKIEETEETPKTETYTNEALHEMTMRDLKELAKEKGINTDDAKKKSDIIDLILSK